MHDRPPRGGRGPELRGGNADDPKAQGRPGSAVLAKEEPEDRQTAQLGYVQDAPGGGEARARSSVLQETLTAGVQWELPGALAPRNLGHSVSFSARPRRFDPGPVDRHSGRT